MNDAKNKGLIAGHEGRRLIAYYDTRGFLTVGDGFNLDAPSAERICEAVDVDYRRLRAGGSLTADQCDAIFDIQYEETAQQARYFFPVIDQWPDNASAVVCDMIFQLGSTGFARWRHFIAFMGTHDWKHAAGELEGSLLAHQVPKRVQGNIDLLNSIS